ELFGQAVGCFENASASKSAASRLVLLPALGPDEGLSSSCLRKALAECLATCRQHGCASEELLTCLLYHGLRSAAALKREAESADERGERVKPTLAAVPQFSMIGPAYLYVYKLTDSRGTAVWAASLGESLLTFAPQRRNAQIQYNAVRPASQHLEVAPMSRISGPGFGFHVWRNAVAMMGIRLFSPYTEQVVRHIPTMDERPETKAILSDFSASIVSSFLSMPFNHVFSWACCSPELAEMSQLQRLQAYANFLIGNYCAPGRLSLLGRDLCVRIGYTGFLFTGYHIVERQMHKLAAGPGRQMDGRQWRQAMHVAEVSETCGSFSSLTELGRFTMLFVKHRWRARSI
ncbi:unnamed protein product, partial [Effrenium voratum]